MAAGAVIADKRAAARSGLDHFIALELAVRPCNRVGVHCQVKRELLDGWELLSRGQDPDGDGALDLFNQLEVDRYAGACIDREYGRH